MVIPIGQPERIIPVVPALEPGVDVDAPVIPPAIANDLPALPFPLVESRPSSSHAEHGHPTAEQPAPPSPSSLPSSKAETTAVDETDARDYIRKQREHYFRLLSPESTPSRSSPIPSVHNEAPGEVESQTPGAGPSSAARGTVATESEPPMVALPPSPPLSDYSNARTGAKRRRVTPLAGSSYRLRPPVVQSDSFNADPGQSELANWVATNPNFTLNIPPGWSLSNPASASSSRPASQVIPDATSGSSAVSETSRSASFSWDAGRPSSISGSDNLTSPTTADPATPQGDAEPPSPFAPSLPQLRPWPPNVSSQVQAQVPPLDFTLARKPGEITAFGPPASPSIAQSSSSATPRRPPLPPTTPNDELPPPSPRPSHARPSPLPKAGFPSSHLADIASTSQPTPSPLHQLAASSSSTSAAAGPVSPPLGATYRAPEDLAIPDTSYFPPPDAYEEDVDADEHSDDADSDSEDDENEPLFDPEIRRQFDAAIGRLPPLPVGKCLTHLLELSWVYSYLLSLFSQRHFKATNQGPFQHSSPLEREWMITGTTGLIKATCRKAERRIWMAFSKVCRVRMVFAHIAELFVTVAVGLRGPFISLIQNVSSSSALFVAAR